MKAEPTRTLPNEDSFEEQVFARFDTVNSGLDTVDIRLESLESRAYDTKPIWEEALKQILETGLEVGELKNKAALIETRTAVIESKLDLIETEAVEVKTEVVALKTDYAIIRNELAEMKRELKHHLNPKLDLILKFLLEGRDDMREADARIKQLETKLA